MRSDHLLMLATLLAAPFALGHIPEGTPKDYCEEPYEWEFHEYVSPADGRFLAPPADGNLSGDCDVDGVPGDFDGHREWTPGGAWLAARSEPGWSLEGQYGGGSVECLGETAHHPVEPSIWVSDVALGWQVRFRVAADHLHVGAASWPSCGDFEAEVSLDCYASCNVPFPPGLDGAYLICVEGTQGHVMTSGWWGDKPPGPVVKPSPGAGKWCGEVSDDLEPVEEIIPYVHRPHCMDEVDNDGDGSVDWVNDSDCNSPIDETEQS